MSQPGLLTEDEIKGFVNENFSLRTDRESYLRPTRDFVIDIYSKFLDDLHPKWRRPRTDADDFEETNVKASLVRWIRFLVGPYATLTFHMGDLLMPTRKRTIAFMNVLIYVKALIDDKWADWQQMIDQWAANKEGSDRVNKELEALRLELEEAAFRKATSDPVDKIKREIAEKKSVFNAVEQKSEGYIAEGAKIKERIKAMSETLLRKKVESDAIKRQIEGARKISQFIDEASALEEKLNAVNHMIKTVEPDFEIEEGQLRLDLEREIASTKDRTQRSALEIERLKGELETIKKERADLEAKQQATTDKCRAYIEKANRQLDVLTKRTVQSENLTQQGLATLLSSKARLEAFTGVKPKEVETLPANRTYIKEATPAPAASQTFIR